MNPNATPEARALLQTLCAVWGKGVLFGQYNFPNQRSQDTDRVFTATGKYPAIWGSDFGFPVRIGDPYQSLSAWKSASTGN